jgi:CDP-diacylglycerol--inositol 3-phosphatidyltransferase
MVSLWLYVPNIIDYFRIIFMFVAYIYADSDPYVFFFCYAISQILDMFDGIAARALRQTSKFGAMLDMVTDRCSTVGLLVVIAQRYPQWTLYCHIFIWLDIFSHWAHMLATISSGSESHKNIKDGPWLLRKYYQVRAFMVILIIGAEGFPLSLYLLSHKEVLPQIVVTGLRYLNFVICPLFCMKHLINVIQFIHAAKQLDAPATADKEKKQ